MAFDIDPEVKAQLLQQRIDQLNLEGYQHELNAKTGEALGDQAMIDQAQSAIAIIETAITVAQSELGSENV